MQTTDRMMIVGLALQGMLANPRTDPHDIDGNTGLALHYAAQLEMKVPDEQGEPLMVKLVRICSVAYSVYVQGIDRQDIALTWADTGDDTKQAWFDAATLAIQGQPVFSVYDDSAAQIVLAPGAINTRSPLSPAACAIIKAVVAGWLQAEG